jgi:hypothetical protein
MTDESFILYPPILTLAEGPFVGTPAVYQSAEDDRVPSVVVAGHPSFTTTARSTGGADPIQVCDSDLPGS